MGLSLTLSAALSGYITDPAVVGSVADTIGLSKALGFVTGAGAGQAVAFYTHKINLAASGTETLDLTNLVDPLGVAVDFARVKALMVIADAGNTNDIVIGAAATPWNGPLGAVTTGGTSPTAVGTVSTAPGGFTALGRADATGWPTVDSTGMNLKIANSSSGTGVTGTLVVIGAIV